MIGCVHEDENGMFYLTKQLKGSNINQLETIEQLDFNTCSPNDFYSFLEYHEVTDYIFISDGERIVKFTAFMNHHYSIKFQLIHRHPSSLPTNIFKEKSVDTTDFQVNVEQGISYTKKELHLMLTGHYPLNYKDNLIRHLYVEHHNLIDNINPSILKNSIINVVLFYDNCTSQISSELFPIMINLENEVETIKSMKLIQMTKEEIMDAIWNFQNSGEVLNVHTASGVIDYATIMNIDRNQRLFYFRDGIYVDYRQTRLVTSTFNADFYEIVNYFSFMNSSNITPVMRIFPMIMNISGLLNKRKMYMVTPYNRYFNRFYLDTHKSFTFIGMVFDGNYYLYHVLNNKNYKVNKAFMIILEFYLKDNLHSKELQKYFPNKLASLKKAFHDVIVEKA